ncbi:MAG: hypothetical protein RJP96_03090, partial [Algiphilus sp.]|uniref:hypothetical protein n=1 Tax=Algiphilus sp. TaxID=1872431 RepID=UPI0032EF3A9A
MNPPIDEGVTQHLPRRVKVVRATQQAELADHAPGAQRTPAHVIEFEVRPFAASPTVRAHVRALRAVALDHRAPRCRRDVR